MIGVTIVVLASAFITGSSGGGGGGRPVPEEVEEVLGALNMAVELLGANYVKTAVPVTLPGAGLVGLRVGDLSTWEWTRCPLVEGGLAEFSLEASFGLRPLQFLSDDFTVGTYSGPLSIIVLDNAVRIGFNVTLGIECKVTLGRFELEDFGEPRFRADRQLFTSDFMLDVSDVLDSLKSAFFSEARLREAKTSVNRILTALYCRGGEELVSVISDIVNDHTQ